MKTAREYRTEKPRIFTIVRTPESYPPLELPEDTRRVMRGRPTWPAFLILLALAGITAAALWACL